MRSGMLGMALSVRNANGVAESTMANIHREAAMNRS